jgi:hypothetical protein
VSDRFTRGLEQIDRGFVAKEAEPKMEQLIRGMRFLKIQVYPMEAFEEAIEFMDLLAKLFDSASGSRIKTALAETLTELLASVVTVSRRCLPSRITVLMLCQTATAEVNHPLWMRAMQSIHTRATSMIVKPRYWQAALPLVCAAVSAAPQDILLANWQTSIDLCFAKFKVSSCFFCVCRLFLTYTMLEG